MGGDGGGEECSSTSIHLIIVSCVMHHMTHCNNHVMSHDMLCCLCDDITCAVTVM